MVVVDEKCSGVFNFQNDTRSVSTNLFREAIDLLDSVYCDLNTGDALVTVFCDKSNAFV